jgi:DNA-binding response OmpR family regulator
VQPGDYVLVIDDDADLRESLALALGAAGHAFSMAKDGLEALAQLRDESKKSPPCVVLLDLMMPNMNGFELRSVMKADPALSPIPVVVMTGAGSLATRRAAELDAEILMKPVDLRDLLTVVERHCRRGPIQIQ